LQSSSMIHSPCFHNENPRSRISTSTLLPHRYNVPLAAAAAATTSQPHILGDDTKLTHTIDTQTNNIADEKNNNQIIEKSKPIDNEDDDNDDDDDDFQQLIEKAVLTLVKSDTDGEELDHSTGSASQGLWVHAPAAKEMQRELDNIVLKMPQDLSIDSVTNIQNEKSNQWLQWMKTTPTPLFLDLTTHIHELITQNREKTSSSSSTNNPPWVSDDHLELTDMTLEQFTSRIACHVILLPSGAETSSLSLVETTGAHVYGKLLYGGVSRYRLLKSGKTVRRVGEKREVMAATNQLRQQPSSSRRQYSHPSWVQLGGLERKYEALDIGPAAILEVTLLPRLWQDLPTVFEKSVLMGGASVDMTMSDAAFGWDPSIMLQRLPPEEEEDGKSDDGGGGSGSESASVFESLEGKQRNDALTSHFQSRVGGLQTQIDAIVRRVLDGRSIYSTHNGDGSDGKTMNQARLEAEELSLLGLQPVRGMLLYGKPGVGKTLIVREIARVLSSRPPKIIAAPEILDRWVGGSERLVRELFQDAEDELKLCQMEAATGEEDRAFLNSALHVICIDEVDAVFRNRIDSNDSGAITRNSVVNQLLAKLDGVHALPNVLMIGMTNRRELLDPALLRPGRLEVQIEIPLPGRSERREILNIHFGALRMRNRLSYPLCCAIDGQVDGDIASPVLNLNKGRKRRALKKAANNVIDYMSRGIEKSAYDLADETEGFSGADIEGLVRCAGSIALSRVRKDGGGVGALLITLDDVKEALLEVAS